MEHLLNLKKMFIERIAEIDETLINGHPVKSLPHLVSCSVRYVEGESMVLHAR